MTYRIRQIGAVVAAAVLTASCAKDDLNWLIGTPITVTATTEQPTTRTGADIQTANFESGATINAYYSIQGGDAIGKTPTILTASAANASTGKNSLTPDVQPYYPESGTVDIMALYPTTVTNSTTSFTVQADQAGETNYKSSDLMWAGISGQARTTGDVNLQFAHLMAKMTVTVTAKEGVHISKVSLVNTVRTIPLTTLSAQGYVMGSVNTNTSDKTIVVASTTNTTPNNTLTGSVLFPPQTVSGQFIKVETDGYGVAYYNVTNKEFKRGESYSANLVVKRQDIGFTSTITDWSDNGNNVAIPPGNSAGLKIANIDPIPYDGTPKTPELVITYTPNDNLGVDVKPYTLEKGYDYVAEYYNNTNQGTAMVIITGKRSSKRENTDTEVLAGIIAQIKTMFTFEITAATGNISYTEATKSVEYDYNTTVSNPLNKNNGDGKFTYSSSNPAVADVTISGVVTMRSVGTTTITANMDNSGNYTAAQASYTLNITERSIKNHYLANGTGDITVALASDTETFPYTGQEHRPAVVLKDKGRTLQEGKHYTTSYANNTAVGPATITISGMGNYKTGAADAIQKQFTIAAITPEITMDESDVILAKGQKYTRRARTDYGTVSYSVSDDTYATVSADGVVTAKECGSNHATQKVTVTASVAADGSNNWSGTSKSYDLYVTESNWTYGYTGTVQEWPCPVDGFYELEAMGAQGATAGSFKGGRGADVAGQVYLKKGQVLYIYVGQGGSENMTAYSWNGGGYGLSKSAGGGGATDFALQSGEWNSAEHLNSRIIVAGGGGGALNASGPFIGGGGSGGGEGGEEGDNIRADYVGEAGYAGSHPGLGGTLSAGGAVTTGGTGGNAGTFGKGGHYNGANSNNVGCGGGGWFGGGSGSDGTRQGSGGGGSSFIYNAANLAAANSGEFTYSLSIPAATDPVTNYITASNLEITPTKLITGGSPDVNGQARITYMSAE